MQVYSDMDKVLLDLRSCNDACPKFLDNMLVSSESPGPDYICYKDWQVYPGNHARSRNLIIYKGI